jgi:hypothetical protein
VGRIARFAEDCASGENNDEKEYHAGQDVLLADKADEADDVFTEKEEVSSTPSTHLLQLQEFLRLHPNMHDGTPISMLQVEAGVGVGLNLEILQKIMRDYRDKIPQSCIFWEDTAAHPKTDPVVLGVNMKWWTKGFDAARCRYEAVAPACRVNILADREKDKWMGRLAPCRDADPDRMAYDGWFLGQKLIAGCVPFPYLHFDANACYDYLKNNIQKIFGIRQRYCSAPKEVAETQLISKLSSPDTQVSVSDSTKSQLSAVEKLFNALPKGLLAESSKDNSKSLNEAKKAMIADMKQHEQATKPADMLPKTKPAHLAKVLPKTITSLDLDAMIDMHKHLLRTHETAQQLLADLTSMPNAARGEVKKLEDVKQNATDAMDKPQMIKEARDLAGDTQQGARDLYALIQTVKVGYTVQTTSEKTKEVQALSLLVEHIAEGFEKGCATAKKMMQDFGVVAFRKLTGLEHINCEPKARSHEHEMSVSKSQLLTLTKKLKKLKAGTVPLGNHTGEKSNIQAALEGFLQTGGMESMADTEKINAEMRWDMAKLDSLATNFRKDFPEPCRFWQKPKAWYGLSQAFDLGKCMDSFVPEQCKITLKVNKNKPLCGNVDAGKMARNHAYLIRKAGCLDAPFVNFDLNGCYNFLQSQSGIIRDMLQVITTVKNTMDCMLKHAGKMTNDAMKNPIAFANDFLKHIMKTIPAVMKSGVSDEGKGSFKFLKDVFTVKGGQPRIDTHALLHGFHSELKKLGAVDPAIKCMEPIIETTISLLDLGGRTGPPAVASTRLSLMQSKEVSEQDQVVDWIQNDFWGKNVKPFIANIFSKGLVRAVKSFMPILKAGGSQDKKRQNDDVFATGQSRRYWYFGVL